ncbi:cytochrome P450 [Jatrophihabitans fulvus]
MTSTVPAEHHPVALDFDINDQRIAHDPYRVYEQLRAIGPVVYSRAMGYVVTSFALADEVLRDWETYSSTQGKGPNPAAVRRRLEGTEIAHTYADFPVVPIEVDPPVHAGYRGILGPTFSAPAVRSNWGDMIRRTARELLDGFGGRDVVDMATEFAIPMAGLVLAGVAGLPAKDRPLFQEWATDIDGHMAELDTYLRVMIDRAGTGVFADLGRAEIDGRALTAAEKTGYGLILIHAGWESTGSAIATAVHFLATHPEHRAALAADPSLTPAAVEELLRTDTPAQALWRTTTRDTVLGGVPIPAGEKVLVLWGAANRDDGVFDGGGLAQLDRSPNRHMVFGRGIHACLGQHLARLELRTAIDELLAAYPHFGLADEAGIEIHQGAVRAIRRLPVRLTTQE